MASVGSQSSLAFWWWHTSVLVPMRKDTWGWNEHGLSSTSSRSSASWEGRCEAEPIANIHKQKTWWLAFRERILLERWHTNNSLPHISVEVQLLHVRGGDGEFTFHLKSGAVWIAHETPTSFPTHQHTTHHTLTHSRTHTYIHTHARTHNKVSNLYQRGKKKHF